jgi:hypothetical protein
VLDGLSIVYLLTISLLNREPPGADSAFDGPTVVNLSIHIVIQNEVESEDADEPIETPENADGLLPVFGTGLREVLSGRMVFRLFQERNGELADLSSCLLTRA